MTSASEKSPCRARHIFLQTDKLRRCDAECLVDLLISNVKSTDAQQVLFTSTAMLLGNNADLPSSPTPIAFTGKHFRSRKERAFLHQILSGLKGGQDQIYRWHIGSRPVQLNQCVSRAPLDGCDAKLIRSMSHKGCSPDNAACEGFFGRPKWAALRYTSGTVIRFGRLHQNTLSYCRVYAFSFS